MANIGNPTLSLGNEALLGVLLAASGGRRIPARPWPLTAACEVIARGLPTNSALRASATAAARGEAVAEAWLRVLARRGHVLIDGTGISACWVVSAEWVNGWGLVADALLDEKAEGWDRAAQCLAKCLSTWEKTVAAAIAGVEPSHSVD